MIVETSNTNRNYINFESHAKNIIIKKYKLKTVDISNIPITETKH